MEQLMVEKMLIDHDPKLSAVWEKLDAERKRELSKGDVDKDGIVKEESDE
jgi:hypothetical protein